METILRNANGIEPGVRVRALRIADVTGAGLVGSVTRMHVEYDPPSATGPRSLILKRPSTRLEESRELSAVEAKFYLSGIPDLSSVSAPRLYDRGRDASNGTAYLLLEDLGDSGFVRQIAGCTGEQAARAIGAIATLHARWWNVELPSRLDWVRPLHESPVGQFCRRWIQSYKGAWPEVLGCAPAILRARYDAIASQLAAGPRTIVHGDYHSQNVSFGKGGTDVRLIDFQFVHHASGMIDVARFLATSLQVDVRRAIEWDLLRDYHSALRAHGVAEYDFNRCIDDFRLALLWNLTTPLALHLVGLMTRGEPWGERFPIIERCLAAIEDWDALACIGAGGAYTIACNGDSDPQR